MFKRATIASMTTTAGYVPNFTRGDGIRKAIESSPYSIQGVASEIGVERNTIGNWIAGRTQPSKASLMAIAQVTGVSLEWLLQLDSNQQPFDLLGGLVFDVVAEAERLLLEAVEA